MRTLFLFSVILTSAFVPRAQPTDVEDHEVAEVIAAVSELWEAMRTGDSTRARAVIHEDAIGYSVGMRGEETTFRHDTPDAFITAIGSPHEEVWDERVSNERVEIDGSLATYWADYEFWLGEQRLHCGVDAFQLYKTGEGWKLFVLSDTRRACE